MSKVMAVLVWPSRSLTSLTGTPAASSSVAWGVPQVVQPDRRQVEAAHQGPPRLADPTRIEWPAAVVGEHRPVRTGAGRCGDPLPQRVEGAVIEAQGAGPPRLRGLPPRRPVGDDQRGGDGESRHVEVDVAVTEAEQLAAAGLSSTTPSRPRRPARGGGRRGRRRPCVVRAVVRHDHRRRAAGRRSPRFRGRRGGRAARRRGGGRGSCRPSTGRRRRTRSRGGGAVTRPTPRARRRASAGPWS